MNLIKKLIFIIVVAVLLGGVYMLFVKNSPPPPPLEQPPMHVKAANPVIQNVTHFEDFTGTVRATETVDIRARVKGFLRNITFEDGQFVKEGDLLFEIEPESYQALRDRAQADLKSSQANLARAEQDYQRVEMAVKDNAVSLQDVGKYKADRDMAEAAVMAAEAALAQAELDLSYTKIYSPVSGKISETFVDIGNLVGATEMTSLARVVALDTVYVYFDVSESLLLDNFSGDSFDNGNGDGDGKKPQAFYAQLTNGKDQQYQGTLDYMDNTVDSNTGTITIRGTLENPDHKILPGMFVRVKVPTSINENAILVQEKAIGMDLAGKYVFVVDANNIVRHRNIEVSDQVDDLRVVTKGLKGDELYLLTALQLVKPGSPVVPELKADAEKKSVNGN